MFSGDMSNALRNLDNSFMTSMGFEMLPPKQAYQRFSSWGSGNSKLADSYPHLA